MFHIMSVWSLVWLHLPGLLAEFQQGMSKKGMVLFPMPLITREFSPRFLYGDWIPRAPGGSIPRVGTVTSIGKASRMTNSDSGGRESDSYCAE